MSHTWSYFHARRLRQRERAETGQRLARLCVLALVACALFAALVGVMR